tara:strand:+ start:3429 stop:4331 length:903 start_codon:yes stop_codon:yes gene_type:complete
MRSKQKLFDVFLFLNELDLLELRLKTLYPIVDYFVITEINETFSGKSKSLIFEKNRERFKQFNKKIIYNPITAEELLELKRTKWRDYVSDLNKSLSHKHNGKPAKYIKESLKREISHRDSAILGFFDIANKEDFILLSDLDEIPDPEAISLAIEGKITKPCYFKMKWFLYWINNQVSEPWFGTVLFRFKNLKGNSLDNFRFASSNEIKVPGEIIKNGGWHFSYLGGIDAIIYKLKSHPFQGYKVLIALILNKLKIRQIKNTVRQNKDIFLKNRTLSIIDIDDSYPSEMLKDKDFIKKYSY